LFVAIGKDNCLSTAVHRFNNRSNIHWRFWFDTGGKSRFSSDAVIYAAGEAEAPSSSLVQQSADRSIYSQQ